MKDLKFDEARKIWAVNEIEVLIQKFSSLSTKDLIKILNRSGKSISAKAYRLNLLKTKECKHISYSKNKINNHNPQWKGAKVGYIALHNWVRKRLPPPEFCDNCKKSKPYDLANIEKYDRNLNHWKWLCRKCHMIEDKRIYNLKQYRR